jgi:hypothetical protein
MDKQRKNEQVVATALSLAVDETLITPAQFKERFKVGLPAQAAQRRDGSGPPFIKQGGQILYPLSLAIKHFENKLVTCSAQLSEEARASRNKNLAEARAKARLVLDAKHAEKIKHHSA